MDTTNKKAKKLLLVTQLKDASSVALLKHVDSVEEDLADKLDDARNDIGEKLDDIAKSVETPINQEVSITGAEIITIRGKEGKPGLDGKDGTNGKDGKDGLNGKDGAKGERGETGSQGVQGPKGEDGFNGRMGDDGAPGKNGKDGRDGSPDTGSQIIDKINKTNQKIDEKNLDLSDITKRIDQVKELAKNSATSNAPSLPITTSFINGVRAKNLNFVGPTVTYNGDTATVDTTNGSGTGGPDNFSYEEIASGVTITIPLYQQMIVQGGPIIEGTLNIIGSLVLI